MRAIIAVFLISAWHVLLPGHVKTILLASRISGLGRRDLVSMAAGYGILHGIIMGAAISVGIVFSDAVRGLFQSYGLFLGNLYIIVLFFMSVYFARLAFKVSRGKVRRSGKCSCEGQGEGTLMREKPFTSGMALGILPCGGTIGLMLIGPAFFETMGKSYVASAFIASWTGVVVAVLTLAVIFGFVPADKIKKRLPEWIPFAAASAICLAVAFWRGVVLWKDIYYLS